MTNTGTDMSTPVKEELAPNEAMRFWSFGMYMEKKEGRQDKEFEAAKTSDLAMRALEFMLDEIENGLGERTIGESSTPFRAARSSGAYDEAFAMIPLERRREIAAPYVTEFLLTILRHKPESTDLITAGAILLLRLSQACDVIWNQGLRTVIGATVLPEHPRKLRIVDQEIRRQTSQLRSAQLCQSQLHRRFLDIFLEEGGVTRLEQELDAQLIAAERLADWYDEKRHRSAEDGRNILLVLIGVFGVFGLASYLTLANGKDDPPYFYSACTYCEMRSKIGSGKALLSSRAGEGR